MTNGRSKQVDDLYAQGSAAFRAGRYAEACAHAERAIALEPGLGALHFLLGSARLELRDFSARRLGVQRVRSAAGQSIRWCSMRRRAAQSPARVSA
jgi:Flp pilus assembly protein TadD